MGDFKDNFEGKRKPDREEVLSFFWEVVKIVVVALAIIVPVRYYLFQPFFVKGVSMEPGFNDGDYVLIDEITYRFREPGRGEVIVFRSPQDRSQFYIKRIIGLPGEQLEISNNKITIFNEQTPQGFTLNEASYLVDEIPASGTLRAKVGENEYFVLGDNRLNSSDSRYWGNVNKKFITGRVFLRAWPLNKIAKFEPVSYPFK